VKTVKAKAVHGRIVIPIERQRPIVGHHRQRLLDPDAGAAHGLDGHVHANAMRQILDGGHRILHTGVDRHLGAQLPRQSELAVDDIDDDHQRGART